MKKEEAPYSSDHVRAYTKTFGLSTMNLWQLDTRCTFVEDLLDEDDATTRGIVLATYLIR